MSVNFFESQAKAKRNTTYLVFLYLLAVVGIVVAVYGVVVFSVQAGHHWGTQEGSYAVKPPPLWQPQLFMGVAVLTLVLVCIGSLSKIWQLGKGGEAVARMLGGTPIFPNSEDPAEKRVLNIVEEMAIASGLPVPRVFLLAQEEGINAFAAGYTTRDAVIGVSAGCLKTLNRDELQGVMAHEFSHILNGDMRLNIRLMAVLGGIMLLATTGYIIFRTSLASPRYYSNREGNSSRGGIAVFGFLIFLIGWIGALFARIIKSAVSRQREFLADASAVQFTRNPHGIANALRKIGGYAGGSKITSPSAEEVSHMFFAEGVQSFLSTLFATHPPLEVRIKRLDSSFRPELEKPQETTVTFHQPSPEGVSNLVGNPQPNHLHFAEKVVQALPLGIKQMAHDTSSARAIVFCLLLNEEPGIRSQQIDYLKKETDFVLRELIVKNQERISTLGPEFKLPLASACLPALSELPPSDYMSFRVKAQHLVEIDEKCNVFEYALQRMLRRTLDDRLFGRPKREVRSSPESACIQLLGSLAYLGHAKEVSASRAFETGLEALGGDFALATLDPQWNSLRALDDALYELEEANLDLKQRTLKACTACIETDHMISLQEAELIRAIADGLGLPLPPLVSA